MSEQQATSQQRRECLSALMDGDAQALGAACAAWREDADARGQWHAYHLIGDVLRSEELAQSPAADASFLSALRARLAAEPVVLAPASRSAAAPRRRWLASAAIAAGFVVVAGVLVVTRGVLPGDSPAPQMAVAPTPAPVVRAAAVEPVLADSALIRDARLDRYLSAHKQYGGSSALGLPGGVLQRASTVAPEQR
jgi:sigma-E factor negative regulatory protein RseA